MGGYVLRRLAQSAVLIFAVATLVAVLVRLIPGDPVQVLLGEGQATPERVRLLREQLGLEKPVHVQYLEWLGRLVRGDLGVSLISRRAIGPDLLQRLPRTLELTVAATLLALAVGLPAGILAAVNRNGPVDLAVSVLALLGLSAPVFVLGTLLVLVFGLYLRVFPATGFVDLTQDPWGHVSRLLLPAATLAAAMAGVIARMARSAMLVLAEDYLRTARAKGLTERAVVFGHALPNALIPVVAVVGVQMGSLLGGSVIVEYIFNWPGLSTYLLQGIAQRDYPVVQAVVLVVSALFILLNLLTDLSYGLLDPRIRYG
ncbi:MAG: glutathione ABC transporter permease GsiC [Chloroflexota bacterium]